MPCRLLVAAMDLSNGLIPKGAPGTVRDYHPAGPGLKERLPYWVSIIITDADKAEIKALDLRQQWFIKFKHEIISEKGVTVTVRTSVADEFLDVSQTAKNVMKNKMIAFLQNEANATSITFANDSVTFNVIKQLDLVALKYKFADAFDTTFHARKFYFTDAEVDAVIALGGEVELTKAQFLTRLKNKLDD